MGRDDDPETTEQADADLEALGRATALAVIALIRRLARGEARVEPRDTWFPDPTVKEFPITGGLVAFIRPLRPDEPRRSGGTDPALLLIRVLPAREVNAWREEVQRMVAEKAREDEAG